MKIKLDENLPDRLVPVLGALGHDVDTSRAEGLTGHDDSDVWNAAQAAERFLITQDLDFSDVRRYAPGTHAGLLLVRLAHPGRNALLERVSTLFRTEHVTEWTACLVVATDASSALSGRHRPVNPSHRLEGAEAGGAARGQPGEVPAGQTVPWS